MCVCVSIDKVGIVSGVTTRRSISGRIPQMGPRPTTPPTRRLGR